MIRHESAVCASGVPSQPFRSRRRLGETKRESYPPGCECQMKESRNSLYPPAHDLRHNVVVPPSPKLQIPYIPHERIHAFKRGGMKRGLEL